MDPLPIPFKGASVKAQKILKSRGENHRRGSTVSKQVETMWQS